jgi:hypothetical protein
MTTHHSAAASTSSGRQITLDVGEREQLENAATGTPGVTRLAAAARHSHLRLGTLSRRALRASADGKLIDANDPSTYRSATDHARFILDRHGQQLSADRLAATARDTLIAEQARIDTDAGLDWAEPDEQTFTAALERANGHGLPITLQDPAVWAFVSDRRAAVAEMLGLGDRVASDLSRWITEHPAEYDADDPACWRIGSPQWLQALTKLAPPVQRVDRPVGVFVAPRKGKWAGQPVLSVDMMRLVGQLGGTVNWDLTSAHIPAAAGTDLARAVSGATLRYLHEHDAAKAAAELGGHVSTPPLIEPIDRWGYINVLKSGRFEKTAKDEITVMAWTDRVRGFPTRRFGARVHNSTDVPSEPMALGEIIDAAVQAGVPVVLSSEAAGQLGAKPRVGRMHGRPGLLTVTSAVAGQIDSTRLPAEQLPAALRTLRDAGCDAVLDAGAVQSLRMTLARPLDDDPILLPPQRKLTAMKVVGSGVDASATGAGKTVTTLRALYHRAQTTPRLRALLVAEARLTTQWRDEMLDGDPGRGMPALCPNVQAVILDDRESVAGQVRRADRRAGERPLVVLCPDGLLDRHPADLQIIDWHVIVADEVLRYANTATDAFRALRQVRRHAGDCWLLSATPKGRTAEHLDVLVGLALDEDVMINSKINVREGGDLLIERNAARVRANYGPHLVRITKQDMAPYMPDTLPAEALGVDADEALAELLREIRDGGVQAYRQMRSMLAQISSMGDAPEAELKAARAELSRWQGMVLGNVGVYVAASVDPEALMSSDSLLAKSLVRSGSVQRAMRAGGNGMPLLRAVTAESVAKISTDEQVIVFCDRVVALRRLGAAIRDVHAIDARVADGSTGEAEFAELKRAFQAGEYPVLCLSKVGQKGHNLQGASSIVHYDLPWLDVDLEQRVGRAVRAGSKHAYVSSYIPYIRGGGIEHVVSMLAPRGAEGHNLLDGFEGVSASKSVVAGQLGDIASKVSVSKQAEGRKQAAARLRVAAAVFGRC